MKIKLLQSIDDDGLFIPENTVWEGWLSDIVYDARFPENMQRCATITLNPACDVRYRIWEWDEDTMYKVWEQISE